MDITYFGHSCFRLKGKAEFTNQPVTILHDPFDPSVVGLPLGKIDTDIVTVSHQHPDHNFVQKVNPDYFLIDQPGEYEVHGVSVLGYSVDHDQENGGKRGKNTIFVIEVEGCRLAHLGDLGRPLTDHELSAMGVIDVLFLPVGGEFTLNIKDARELINKISPYAVIPMHYLETGTNQENFKGLQTLDKFLGLCQGLKQETTEKYSVIKRNSNDSEPQIIILQRKV